MSDLAVASRDCIAQPKAAAAPRGVKIVLPVWGRNFVNQFLDYGLPSLLAPGNVPAVAAAVPTEFLILTSTYDSDYIRGHAAFRRLSAVCPTILRPIDRLVTAGNHSTTLTLAYLEEIRATGEALVDTCFFLLTSDYIMADGSLGNALARMLGGARALTAGNFQVVREDAIHWLQKKSADAGGDCLSIAPRELMQWGLEHLHSVTLANIVNLPFSHNAHINRLFWRVDDRTLLGRFYLMHCLCVRPETPDFTIGASFDYSFVPELCPSGRVEIMTDSDEYLVVEMQPAEHEIGLLRLGPASVSEIAVSLSEWTTGMHRDNAHHSLLFHAGDVPRETERWIAQSNAFVGEVERRLKREPMPHRNHPYWQGAVAAFERSTGTSLEARIAGPATPPGTLSRWKRKLLTAAELLLIGRPPHVPPWHPLWPDYKTMLRELAAFFAGRHQRLLLVSNEATPLANAFGDSSGRVHYANFGQLLGQSDRHDSAFGKFDLCLVQLTEDGLNNCDWLIDRITPLMKPGATIVIAVPNRRIVNERDFIPKVILHSARFLRPGVLPIEVRAIPANPLRRAARRQIARLRVLLMGKPRAGAAAVVLAAWPLLCLSLIGNLMSLYRSRGASQSGEIASSVLLRLRVEAGGRIGWEAGPARERAGECLSRSADRFDVAPTEGFEICHGAAAYRA
ncbi:MAG TPA: hypothetical protein VMF32_00020 [Xanthobacteraceae bacterium]|nr:hypothetical protein [Xanthobacteraceae bacterium]